MWHQLQQLLQLTAQTSNNIGNLLLKVMLMGRLVDGDLLDHINRK